MAVITFDTLAYSNRLQKSGVPREQAEAISDIINLNELVTKKIWKLPWQIPNMIFLNGW